jgi:DNA replication licensing factor MCM3
MQSGNRTVADHKRKFAELLNDDDGKYSTKLRQNVNDENYRFLLNINEVRAHDADLAAKIVKRPREYLIGLQEAVQEEAERLEPSFEKVLKATEMQVGFDGSLGRNSVSPRELNSMLLNNLVEVEGIVTKCSSIRPKLVKAVQYCPETKQYSTREYRDATSIDIGVESGDGSIKLPTSSTFATEDTEGHKLEIEHGLCKYKNYQTVVLQEMPEKAKVGQLPRSIEVILEHDLVDRAKPGDRILCMGIYRSLPNTQNGVTKGVFRTVLMCNNVQIIGKEVGAVRLTANDIKNIR